MDPGEKRIHIPVSRELAPKARVVYAVCVGMVGLVVVGEDVVLETMSMPEA